MANPTIVQGRATIVGGTTGNLAYSSPTTAGNLLIAVLRFNNGSSTPTLGDGVNTWTLVDSIAGGVGASFSTVQMWCAVNCKGGADTVTATDTSALASALELLIGEYQSGSSGHLVLDAHHAVFGTSSTPASGNCTTNFPNDLLIGWTGNDTGTAITAGLIGGGTALIQESQSSVLAYEDGNGAGNTAGLNSATFGGSQTQWYCGIAAFKVQASGGGGINGSGMLRLLGVD